MKKKKTLFVKIASFLLAAAPITVQSINCAFFIGEPKLPEKLKK